MLLKILIFCWSWASISRGDVLTDYNQVKDEKITDSVLQGLEHALSYMENNFELLNLDALTALRISEAQLRSVVKSDDRVRPILESIGRTIELALPIVQQYEPDYYADLGRLTEAAFWTFREYSLLSGSLPSGLLSRVVRLAQNSTKTNEASAEWLTEDVSDKCLRELLIDNCRKVSSFCMDVMTQPNVGGYTATHQIYYLTIFSQLESCAPDSALQDIQEAKLQLCAGVYLELMTEETDTDLKRDLFMEQIGLCGVAGYWKEFTRPDWIEKVLSWQRSTGCYGNSKMLIHELEALEPSHRFRRSLTRVKREERIMKDGCLCHRTAVAFLALTQNVLALV